MVWLVTSHRHGADVRLDARLQFFVYKPDILNANSADEALTQLLSLHPQSGGHSLTYTQVHCHPHTRRNGGLLHSLTLTPTRIEGTP